MYENFNKFLLQLVLYIFCHYFQAAIRPRIASRKKIVCIFISFSFLFFIWNYVFGVDYICNNARGLTI